MLKRPGSFGNVWTHKTGNFEDVDIGFAFLPDSGIKAMHPSSRRVLSYGKDVLKLPRIVAITNKDNDASGKLLEKLGLRFDRLVDLRRR